MSFDSDRCHCSHCDPETLDANPEKLSMEAKGHIFPQCSQCGEEAKLRAVTLPETNEQTKVCRGCEDAIISESDPNNFGTDEPPYYDPLPKSEPKGFSFGTFGDLLRKVK